MHNPDLGDCIGVESCVDMKTHLEYSSMYGRRLNNRRRRISDRDAAAKKIYPPPIAWLSRTWNSPSHMMKKYSSSDGRLIIREEKVKRHEYFEAHRSNGRLVLNLIPSDDDDDVVSDEHAGDDETVDDDDNRVDGIDGEDDERILDGDRMEERDAMVMKESSGGGGTGCCMYRSMGAINPCGFAVAVPPFRPPVQT